ncbi:hypothetical protein FHT32_001578 [Variovorax sp. SG517]|nr:hypothetical protein [Variovorax sp. SG517]
MYNEIPKVKKSHFNRKWLPNLVTNRIRAAAAFSPRCRHTP